jgi:hypothetical protein
MKAFASLGSSALRTGGDGACRVGVFLPAVACAGVGDVDGAAVDVVADDAVVVGIGVEKKL